MLTTLKQKFNQAIWLEDSSWKRTLKLSKSLIRHKGFWKTYSRFLFQRKSLLNAVMANAPLPRNLYFEVTNRCNAACAFCPYPEMERDKLTMPLDFFQEVIEQYVAIGGRSVGFTPIVGDPMLDKLLFDRIDYLESVDQITTLGFYTNAIGLIPRKIDQFLVPRNIFIDLSISFGGYDKETFRKVMGVDGFDKVRKNLIYLLEKVEAGAKPENLTLKVDYRFPKSSKDDALAVILSRVQQKGLIKSDTLNGVFDTFGGSITQEKLDRAESNFKLNYGVPKTGPCDILFRKPIVLADGRINACAERDLETTLIIGDLKTEKLSDILYGKKMVDLIESFYDRNEIPEVCKLCTVYQPIYDPRSKVWGKSKDLNWRN